MSISRAEFVSYECSCPCHSGVYQSCWCHCKKPSFEDHPFTKTLGECHRVTLPYIHESTKYKLENEELWKIVRNLEAKLEKLEAAYAEEAEACREIIFSGARRSELIKELSDRLGRLETRIQNDPRFK